MRQSLSGEGLEAAGLDGNMWERLKGVISERRGVFIGVVSGFTCCSLSLKRLSLWGAWKQIRHIFTFPSSAKCVTIQRNP